MNEKNVLLKLSFADSFTIINGILGLFSIYFSIQEKIYISFAFILLCVLADGMDGIVARKYGGYLGRYLDEFSDIVSFLIAPCILTYIFYEVKFSIPFIFSSALFIIFGMLHLVNYHISKKDFFIGITTPASAIIIISLSYLYFPFYLVIISFIILSFLMIINIYYPRIEKHFAIVACIIIFLAITGIKLFVYLLLFSTIVYIVVGPFYFKYSRKNF